jgi:hypothetical protein
MKNSFWKQWWLDKKLNPSGLSLLETVIGLALGAVILEAVIFSVQPFLNFFKARQAAWRGLENAFFFLGKLSREAGLAAEILNTADRPSDDFHFSFVDSQNRQVTYYLEDSVIKRKLDAVQPLTEEGQIFNQKTNPIVPLFERNGTLIKVNLLLKNQSTGHLNLKSLITIKG